MLAFNLLSLSTLLQLSLASTSLILNLPPTQILPQPQSLPPSTHAVLTSTNVSLTAPLRRNGRFVFSSVPAGSYLCDVWAHEYAFVPMRVDIGAGGGIEVWQTYRGNEWSNTGEKLGAAPGRAEGGSASSGSAAVDEGKVELEINIGVLAQRDFYEKRGGFNPMGLLSNPMILIGIVAMAMMFGMPKLMENMDPEMREEFQKSQQSNPILAALNGAQGGGGAGGFDAAAWLAGTDQAKGDQAKSSGAQSGGGKKRR